jgi:membrane-associated HD superfamily phosphohydrolase
LFFWRFFFTINFFFFLLFYIQSFSVALAIIGGILTVFFVNKLGKRFLTLMTLPICSVCYILIGIIGIYWTDSKPLTSWLVLIFFLTTTFTSSFGILTVAWILVSEIFPMKWVKKIVLYIFRSCNAKKIHYFILYTYIFCFLIISRSRNITCSTCVALGYLMSFFMIKFFPQFSAFVQLYNTFTIFGVAGLFGSVYFYFYLPETENKSLQEISEFFK